MNQNSNNSGNRNGMGGIFGNMFPGMPNPGDFGNIFNPFAGIPTGSFPSSNSSNNNYNGNNQYMNYPNMERQNSYPPQGQKPPFDHSFNQKNAVPKPGTSAFYREEGNAFYLQKHYEKAIESYTKGISVNDTESVLFSNRARCHKILKKYEEAYKDALLAVELDDNNMKAHIILAQVLAEMGKTESGLEKIQKAISKLEKALQLALNQKNEAFQTEIRNNLCRARKLLWYKKKAITKQARFESLNSIKKLIESDKDEKMETRKETIQDIESWIDEVKIKENEYTIPDPLCCKITLDLMNEPFITPSGVTYEKKVLINHFQANGSFDPVTREPLDPRNVYRNKYIQQAADKFIDNNPWAFEYSINENYLNINF